MAEQARLPEVIPPTPPNQLPAAVYYPPVSAPPEIEVTAPSVPLSHAVWILRRHLWKNAGICGHLLVGCLHCFWQEFSQSTNPRASIDIDLAAPTGVVGQGADQFLLL